MAYLDQPLSEEERRQREESGAAASPGSSQSGPSAPASPAPTSGFVNLSRYFEANPQGNPGLTEGTKEEAEAALRSDNPDEAAGVGRTINAGTSQEGLAGIISKDRPTHSQGMGTLDAYLGARGGATQEFENLRKMYGERLGRVESAASRPEWAGGDAPAWAGLEGRNPYHEDMGDALNYYERQQQRYDDYLRRVNEYNAATRAYNEGVSAYEAWRRRRAENIGEEYAPELSSREETRARPIA